jgi:hypothetical protein
MSIAVIRPSNQRMLRCVARASDVKGTWDGFSDSDMPGRRRQLFNYLGFAPPEDAYSPVGATAKPRIGHMQPGFGVTFIKAEPGNGVPFRVHDTNETFRVLEGVVAGDRPKAEYSPEAEAWLRAAGKIQPPGAVAA